LIGSQHIILGPCEEAGWKSLPQLKYLRVPMSHDGSRGGIIEEILLGMDSALGTQYAVEIPKRYRSIERQVVQVIAKMHSHYLGVLSVEELQENTIVTSTQADQMQQFLLRMLNSGIPSIYSGNSGGFSWLANFSQNLRRLFEHPPEYTNPVGALGEDSADLDWDDIFVGVRAYYVLNEPPGDAKKCKQLLRQYSGGTPAYALTLWANAQATALFEGRTFIEPKDITAAYNSPSYDGSFRTIAEALNAKNYLPLMQFSDMPWREYARAWGQDPDAHSRKEACVAPAGRPDPTPVTIAVLDAKARELAKKAQAQQRSATTRARNKDSQRKNIRKTAAADDVRLTGPQAHAIEGLKNLRKKGE
jgi:hypothetical protein